MSNLTCGSFTRAPYILGIGRFVFRVFFSILHIIYFGIVLPAHGKQKLTPLFCLDSLLVFKETGWEQQRRQQSVSTRQIHSDHL